jgi:glutathione S-transferase
VIRVSRIPFSTNVERVALFAGHKGVEVEWVDVDPRDRSAVVAVSGQPLVPVLEADGEVVADSTAIMEWLEARFPVHPLFSAETRIFVDWFNRVWKVPPNRLNDEGPDPALEAELAASRDLFEALLEGRDYLYGGFSAADCAAFPFLKYALRLDPTDLDPFHHVLYSHLALDGRYPRLKDWIGRVEEHPRA